MHKQVLNIGNIDLVWSKWFTFEEIFSNTKKSSIRLENCSAVYEAVITTTGKRLTIGKTTKLKDRLKCLVKGKSNHSAGKKIYTAYPDQLERNTFLVRFAFTSRPAAAEEELHLQHVLEYGTLPLYTDR